MSGRRILARSTVATAVSVVALVSAGLAHAQTHDSRDPRVGRAHDVAGSSPYADRPCNVATAYYTQPGGKEGEPSIAVDPRHPNRRIVAWMDATRATLGVKYTSDGGRSWQRSVPRGVDECTGNDANEWEASGDVWVSFGPDGIAYLSSLSWAHFVTPPASEYVSVVHVQTSRDGGRTWSEPVFLDGQRSVSDKPMVLADPTRRGVAYEIWRNQSFGMPVGDRGATRLLFARTGNAGRTWTRPVQIAAGTPDDFFGTPMISKLRDGTLVATTSLATASGGEELISYRSADLGQSWSGPVVVDTLTGGALAPICDQSAAGADTGAAIGQPAVVRGRTVVLVTLDGAATAAGGGAIVEHWSSDGGRTWRSKTVLHRDRPILLASIASASSGGLGLVWDEIDTAHVDCAAATIPTRTRFGSSRWLGGRVGEAGTVGAAWWNLASGARGTGYFSGYFIGDYQSLTTIPGGFTTVAVQGQSLLRHGHLSPVTGETGVMVATVKP